MLGLGDSIYQRGFLRHFPGAYVVTPWPEIYAGLGLKCLRADTDLRTHSKNAARSDHPWAKPPRRPTDLRLGYGRAELATGSIISTMRRQTGGVIPHFDLPDFGLPPIRGCQPVAIVRPVTIRREWVNLARAPDPRYVAAAALELKRRGFYVVSIADLQDHEEWLVGDAPVADVTFHRGELSVTEMLAATKHAAVVVGGVGWIVPACIAARTPLYVVLGGNGAHNAPGKITDGRFMDLTRIGWARPDRFCMCADSRHKCDKEISGFDRNFAVWLDGQGLFGTRGSRVSVAS